MHRMLFVALAAGAFLALGATEALAQTSSWPETAPAFTRGPGNYLSAVKIIAAWLLFLVWVRTSDWASQDCLTLRLNYALWNPVVVLPFVASFILLWLVPWYWLGIAVMVLAYAGPLGAYVIERNGKVPQENKVLTPQHLRYLFATFANKLGAKIETEQKMPHEKGPPVKLVARAGATDSDNQAAMILSRQSPGHITLRELMADMIDNRADAVMLDYSPEAVGQRYQIDGIWHTRDNRDRESGDHMLAAMKTLALMKPAERVARQQGSFEAEYQGKAQKCSVVSQGVEAGERVVVQLQSKKAVIPTLDELGMRPKMQEQLASLISHKNGFVLVSSMPGNGMSTTLDAVLKAADRFVRDFVMVEDVNRREREVDNVLVTTYDPTKGETAATVLPAMIRNYPNVLVVRELVDADTGKLLCSEARGERLSMSSLRAKECVEALLRVLMLKIPVDDFAPAVTGVLNVRLIRKLCETCKEAYEPTPEMLKQLGVPPGRVEVLYREPTQTENKKQVCPNCNDLYYKGRTGIFELLAVEDTVRQTLRRSPKIDLLRMAARKAGMRTLQEEGIVLVVKGVTSTNELVRVLKQ